MRLAKHNKSTIDHAGHIPRDPSKGMPEVLSPEYVLRRGDNTTVGRCIPFVYGVEGESYTALEMVHTHPQGSFHPPTLSIS